MLGRITFLTLIAGSMVAACCGCTVQTVHSLSECGEVVRDDTVLGEWQERDSTFGTPSESITITRDQSGRYLVRETNSSEPSSLVGCIVEVGAVRYIELQEERSIDQTTTPSLTGIGTHLFARCKIDKNRLTIWQPNYDFFKDAIAARKLGGIIDRRDLITSRAVVTSRADELRDFIASNPEAAFSTPTVFRRARSRADDIGPACPPASGKKSLAE